MVIQIGKWRREIAIPSVAECVDTPITDVNLTRLPRNQSEGHLPKIAVTTGASDALECFVRKLGISDSEFTTDAGGGRVNLFVGGEPAPGGGGQGTGSFSPTFGSVGSVAFPPATTLWGDPVKLATYDMMLLSCEGAQFADVKSPFTGNVKAFADAGGRIIAGHLHLYWLRNGPAPWPGTATYLGPGATSADPTVGTVRTDVSEGSRPGRLAGLRRGVCHSWKPSTLGNGSLRRGGRAADARVDDRSQFDGNEHELLTFDTPVEAAASNQCGRVGYVDFHVKTTVTTQVGKDNSNPTLPYPTGCQSTILTPQEQSLEFMLFDIGACIQ